MRQVSPLLFMLICFLLGTSGLTSGCTPENDTSPSQTPIIVWEYTNETAFNTVYPEGWENSVVRRGMIIFAPPEVAYDTEPGPSMSIRREAPGEAISPLEEELDHFLEYGPLRNGYFLISDIKPVNIGQYEGLEVAVERDATEMFIAMKAVISVIRTESGSLYTFIATAPTEQWEASWPQLLTITQNLKFNE